MEHRLEPLKNLEILYLANIDSLKIRASTLAERDGAYDPRTSRIFVRIKEEPHLSANVTPADISALVSTVFPASLEHEFFHYLFYRPEAEQSGFILEG